MSQGWECFKCGRVYSPTIPFCLYCSNATKTDSKTSSANEDFFKKVEISSKWTPSVTS